MRPIVRGATPTDENGDIVAFTDYKDARDFLIERMGDYCSYCEVALHSAIDVEHVLPKSLNPTLESEWTNFLLACGNCNSIKGNKPVALPDFYWPDQDNTLRAFSYEQDQPPNIDTANTDIDTTTAQATLELTGIDRVPGHPKLSDRDRRWLKRFDAWGLAFEVVDLIASNDTDEMRALAIEVARGRGFFSVWWTVFDNDPDMRKRLIVGFTGTSIDCFDDNGALVPRPTGAI